MPQNEFNQIWDSSPISPAFYTSIRSRILYLIVILSILRVPFVDSIVQWFFLSKRAENVGRVSLIGRHLGNAASSHLHNTTHLHIGIFSCASMAVPTSFKMVAHWGFFFHFSWLPPSSLLFPPPSPPPPPPPLLPSHLKMFWIREIWRFSRMVSNSC